MEKDDWGVLITFCVFCLIGLALLNTSLMFVGLIIYFADGFYPMWPIHKASAITGFVMYAARVVFERIANNK